MQLTEWIYENLVRQHINLQLTDFPLQEQINWIYLWNTYVFIFNVNNKSNINSRYRITFYV